MPAVKSLPMPKPIKAPTPPKIAAVTVKKMGSGFAVQHHMTSGPRPVPFVFSDPAKMLTHLRRIEKAQWREPDKPIAGAITHDLDLGPVS